MCDEVNDVIVYGIYYFWVLLVCFQMKKFYFDFIEVLLGVVWIDLGSIEQCEIMLIYFGILLYLEWILWDNVYV